MKRNLLALVFCLLPLEAFAQAAPPSAAAAPAFDCTEICGNPTCCIAQRQSVPVCAVEGRSAISRLQRLAKQNKSDEIAAICLGETASKGVNPIAPRSFGERLRRISCHWGCCERPQTVTSLERNPALAAKMFAGTKLAALGREISQKGSVSPEAKTQIAREMDGGFLCIFCCHF
jgi:hypothetical protein